MVHNQHLKLVAEETQEIISHLKVVRKKLLEWFFADEAQKKQEGKRKSQYLCHCKFKDDERWPSPTQRKHRPRHCHHQKSIVITLSLYAFNPNHKLHSCGVVCSSNIDSQFYFPIYLLYAEIVKEIEWIIISCSCLLCSESPFREEIWEICGI
jgi:hypothetical protein